MHRRPFVSNQPEPGAKASNKYSERLREFEKFKLHAAGFSVTAGFTAALVSYLLRVKQLNNEIQHRNQNVKELGRLESATLMYRSQPNYASKGNMGSFLASVRGGMVRDLHNEVSTSDLLILQMESDIAGCTFARDGALLMTAFAAAMIVGIVGTRAIAKREEREAAINKKAEEPPNPGRERRIVQQFEDIAHAQTCIPAPVAPPEVAVSEEKFPRPPYFHELFNDLKRSLREEMRFPGSAEAAEAFLCVMPRKEVEDLIQWPETIELHIAANKNRLKEFFKEKGIDPRHLFERLGPEVTDLF